MKKYKQLTCAAVFMREICERDSKSSMPRWINSLEPKYFDIGPSQRREKEDLLFNSYKKTRLDKGHT